MNREPLPRLTTGLAHADYDNVGVVILLVAYRLGEAPQQAEREFLLQRFLRVVLLELADAVLEIGLVAAADELQVQIIRTAARPPVVMALLNSVSHTGPKSGRKNRLRWKEAPIQKQIPRSRHLLTVRFILDHQPRPSTSSVPQTSIRYPVITGAGMDAISPETLGRKAATMMMKPMQ